FSPAGREDADDFFTIGILPIRVDNRQNGRSLPLEANFPEGVPPLFSRFVDSQGGIQQTQRLTSSFLASAFALSPKVPYRYPGGTVCLFSNGACCSVSDDGVVGVPCASCAARLASFLCSRRSAFARCFSCRFISFWRFLNVMLIGLLKSPGPRQHH